MPKTCGYCGKENPIQARKCTECGKEGGFTVIHEAGTVPVKCKACSTQNEAGSERCQRCGGSLGGEMQMLPSGCGVAIALAALIVVLALVFNGCSSSSSGFDSTSGGDTLGRAAG